MTPREELIEIISKTKLPDGCPLGKSFVLVNDEELEIASVLADAIIAAKYRKVEAGRDARETAQVIADKWAISSTYNRPALEAEIATAITAVVEAQRERDAGIVAAAIEMAEACKRAVPSEAATDAEVTRYENARHRLQTVCAAAIREG